MERALRRTMLSVADGLTDENIQQIEFSLRLMGHSTTSQLTCSTRCSCREVMRTGVAVMELMRQRGIWDVNTTTGRYDLQRLRDIFEDIHRFDLARQLAIFGPTEHQLQQPRHSLLSDENQSLSFPVSETDHGDGVECDGVNSVDRVQSESSGGKSTSSAVSSRTTDDSSPSSFPYALQQGRLPLQSVQLQLQHHHQHRQHHLPASPASNQTPSCAWGCGFDSVLESFITWIRR